MTHSFYIHIFRCPLADFLWPSATPIWIYDCKWLVHPLNCKNISLIDIAEGIFSEISLLEIKISSLVREKPYFLHTVSPLIFSEDWEFVERSNWVLRILSLSVASLLRRSKLPFSSTPEAVEVAPWPEIKTKKMLT